LFVEFLEYPKGEKGSTSCEDYCEACQADDDGSTTFVSGDMEEWWFPTDASESLIAAVGGDSGVLVLFVGGSYSSNAPACSSFEVNICGSGHPVVSVEHY
jgi:hypothetical protein